MNYHTSFMAIAPSTIFLSSDAVATICLLLSFVRLLFEGGIHFFENPTDINNGWIRYVQVRGWWLLDVVSSTCNLSVLLSAVGTTRTTQVTLVLAWWPLSEIIQTHVRVPRVLVAATIQGRHSFHSELRIVWLLFEGGNYSRVRCLFEEIRYCEGW